MDGCRQISPDSSQAGVGCDTAHKGDQQPSAAGGTGEKMYKRQQLVCGRLSPAPRCCITRAQTGFGFLRSSVRKCAIKPSLEHLYRHQWPGADIDVQRCSAEPRKSSGSESPARRHLIRQERGKEGQQTPSWTWGKKYCKPEWREEQAGGCPCPWNLHNPARAWCLNEREKGKEKIVNYP